MRMSLFGEVGPIPAPDPHPFEAAGMSCYFCKVYASSRPLGRLYDGPTQRRIYRFLGDR